MRTLQFWRHPGSAAGALAALVLVGAVRTASAEEIGQQSFTQLRSLGAAALTGPGAGGITDSLADARFQRPDSEALLDESDIEGGGSGAPPAAVLVVPTVKNTPVSLVNRGFSGFDGLDHADQRFAGTGAFTNTSSASSRPTRASASATVSSWRPSTRPWPCTGRMERWWRGPPR